jgi:hypothetical protein
MVLNKTLQFIKKQPQILFIFVLLITNSIGIELPIFLFALGTWSSGGNLGTARRYLAGCGTQSAGLSFGGSLGHQAEI